MKATNNFIKEMNEEMKAIHFTLNLIEKDDRKIFEAKNNEEHNNAMARNRNKYFDLIKRIENMSETAKNLYNLYN